MSTKTKTGIKNFLAASKGSKLVALGAVLVVLAVGYTVLRTSAVSYFAAVTVSDGTVSGNALPVSDGDASKGVAIRFGTGSGSGSGSTPDPQPNPNPEPPPPPASSGSWDAAVASRSFTAVRNWYAANTGHEALGLSKSELTPVGNIESTHDGQVIEGVIGSIIKIKHNNVTIRGCRVVTPEGATYGAHLVPTYGNTLTGNVIEYCTFEGPGGNPSKQIRAMSFNSAVAGGITVRNANIYGWTSGAGSEGGLRIEYSWVHDLASPSGSGAHRTSLRATGSGITFYRNYATSGGSSAISMYYDVRPMQNISITENILNGSDPGASVSYLINMKDGPQGPGATNNKILGNMFGDKYQYGVFTDANVNWGSNGNERCGNKLFLTGASVINTCGS